MSLALHRTGNRRPASDQSWTTRLLAAGHAAALAPVRFYRSRQLLNAMAQMSDHELRDIGLTAQDISAATALPLGQDPSVLFAARTAERRTAAH